VKRPYIHNNWIFAKPFNNEATTVYLDT